MTTTNPLIGFGPISFGIIGCGWFGRVHVERLSEIPGVNVAAVCDPDEASAHRLAGLVPAHLRPAGGEVAVYTDTAELLRHAGLNAVSINSPNPWHVEQLLAALEQGLHVLCEKPLTLIPADVDRVVAATRQAERVVAIAYQSRYRRDARLLRRALQSGRWGRVTSVNVFASEDWVRPNVGTWRHDPERCPAGYFGDANSHQIDVTLWLTGLEPIDVKATMETRGTPVPMATWGEARLRAAAQADGTVADVPFTFTFVGDAHCWREEITIVTERADFALRDTQLFWSDGTTRLVPFTEADLGIDNPIESETPDQAFVAALRGGDPVASPPETVWPVLRFTLAALASAGRPLHTS
jgi:predicted dehydrogenase